MAVPVITVSDQVSPTAAQTAVSGSWLFMSGGATLIPIRPIVRVTPALSTKVYSFGTTVRLARRPSRRIRSLIGLSGPAMTTVRTS